MISYLKKKPTLRSKVLKNILNVIFRNLELLIFVFKKIFHRNKTIQGEKYQLQKWEKVLEDFTGKKWKKIVVIRRLSQDDLWYKVQDVFEDGQNVFHKETSPLDDDTLANLKKFWAKNFDKYYRNHPNEIKILGFPTKK